LRAVVVAYCDVRSLTKSHFAGEPELLRYVPNQAGKIGVVPIGWTGPKVAIKWGVDAITDVSVQFLRTKVIVKFNSAAGIAHAFGLLA
jgi:hypothetical protein